MRKLFSLLIPSAFVIVSTFFTSCQKEASAPPELKNNLSESAIKSVNAWIDRQKNPSQPNKATTVELLKNNLDFSGLKYEQFLNEDQLIIIPIKEDFKIQKNVERNSLLNLVLISDKSGVIKNGRIAVYKPEPGKTLNKIPENTFSNVLKTEPIELSGTFLFLSATGKRLHQFAYENGKIKSFGSVEQKPSENGKNGPTSRVNANCTAWYLVTTYYINGIPISQTTEFLGMTCESDGCDDPNIQSICPDGGPGSGGAGTGPADVITTSSESSTVEVPDDTGGPNGTAPSIRYIYNSLITRTNGIVTTAIVYPTVIGNPLEAYVDGFGRNTIRIVSAFGHLDGGTTGAATSLCSWFCYVYGKWTYTDGSPDYIWQWSDSHMAVR